jgi:uncharacterized protein
MVPVTVSIERRVPPGRENEFEEWAADLTRAARRFHGFLGAGLLRPGHVGEKWHVIYRFDSPESLAAWEDSPTRAHWLEAGQHLMETTGVHRVTGLETWFSLPGRTTPAPPKWKMFVVVAAGIYSLHVVVDAILEPIIWTWPLPLRLAPSVIIVTALMTWVVMPRLASLLARWLYAPR